MTIPDNFELAPVKADTHPSPAPPKCRKKELYNDSDAETFFAAIDNHAVEEAKQNYSNFRDLIWNLIFKNNFSDLEKARVIFRWMTCKDMSTLEFESESPSVPERLLIAFKAGSGSYARTFEYMARYAGLHCVSVSGWAKGAEYRPGDRITSATANHSWNALYIDGSWHLVDCHWATRYLRADGDSSSSDSDSKYGFEYDDFYFLTEPEDMVFSHLPIEEKWQLMETTWSPEEFEQRAYIKSQFFTLGLQVMPENSGVIYAEAGLATLSLTFGSKIAFTYRFRHEDGSDELKNLSRYVLQEMTDHRLTYFIRTPLQGNYVLTVFAREFLDDVSPKSMITFKSVAEYKVVNEEDSEEVIPPFPYCSDSSWGLDMYASFSGRRMHPNHRMAVLFCPEGHGEISLNRNGSTMRLYARLVKEGIAFEVLKSCVLIEDKDEEAIVKIDLPELGEYGLEVFVNNPNKDGKLFSHFCQYLCTTETVGRFSEVYASTRDPVDIGEVIGENNSGVELSSPEETLEETLQATSESKVCSGIEIDYTENLITESAPDDGDQSQGEIGKVSSEDAPETQDNDENIDAEDRDETKTEEKETLEEILTVEDVESTEKSVVCHQDNDEAAAETENVSSEDAPETQDNDEIIDDEDKDGTETEEKEAVEEILSVENVESTEKSVVSQKDEVGDEVDSTKNAEDSSQLVEETPDNQPLTTVDDSEQLTEETNEEKDIVDDLQESEKSGDVHESCEDDQRDANQTHDDLQHSKKLVEVEESEALETEMKEENEDARGSDNEHISDEQKSPKDIIEKSTTVEESEQLLTEEIEKDTIHGADRHEEAVKDQECSEVLEIETSETEAAVDVTELAEDMASDHKPEDGVEDAADETADSSVSHSESDQQDNSKTMSEETNASRQDETAEESDETQQEKKSVENDQKSREDAAVGNESADAVVEDSDHKGDDQENETNAINHVFVDTQSTLDVDEQEEVNETLQQSNDAGCSSPPKIEDNVFSEEPEVTCDQPETLDNESDVVVQESKSTEDSGEAVNAPNNKGKVDAQHDEDQMQELPEDHQDSIEITGSKLHAEPQQDEHDWKNVEEAAISVKTDGDYQLESENREGSEIRGDETNELVDDEVDAAKEATVPDVSMSKCTYEFQRNVEELVSDNEEEANKESEKVALGIDLTDDDTVGIKEDSEKQEEEQKQEAENANENDSLVEKDNGKIPASQPEDQEESAGTHETVKQVDLVVAKTSRDERSGEHPDVEAADIDEQPVSSADKDEVEVEESVVAVQDSNVVESCPKLREDQCQVDDLDVVAEDNEENNLEKSSKYAEVLEDKDEDKEEVLEESQTVDSIQEEAKTQEETKLDECMANQEKVDEEYINDGCREEITDDQALDSQIMEDSKELVGDRHEEDKVIEATNSEQEIAEEADVIDHPSQEDGVKDEAVEVQGEYKHYVSVATERENGARQGTSDQEDETAKEDTLEKPGSVEPLTKQDDDQIISQNNDEEDEEKLEGQEDKAREDSVKIDDGELSEVLEEETGVKDLADEEAQNELIDTNADGASLENAKNDTIGELHKPDDSSDLEQNGGPHELLGDRDTGMNAENDECANELVDLQTKDENTSEVNVVEKDAEEIVEDHLTTDSVNTVESSVPSFASIDQPGSDHRDNEEVIKESGAAESLCDLPESQTENTIRNEEEEHAEELRQEQQLIDLSDDSNESQTETETEVNPPIDEQSEALETVEGSKEVDDAGVSQELDGVCDDDNPKSADADETVQESEPIDLEAELIDDGAESTVTSDAAVLENSDKCEQVQDDKDESHEDDEVTSLVKDAESSTKSADGQVDDTHESVKIAEEQSNTNGSYNVEEETETDTAVEDRELKAPEADEDEMNVASEAAEVVKEVDIPEDSDDKPFEECEQDNGSVCPPVTGSEDEVIEEMAVVNVSKSVFAEKLDSLISSLDTNDVSDAEVKQSSHTADDFQGDAEELASVNEVKENEPSEAVATNVETVDIVGSEEDDVQHDEELRQEVSESNIELVTVSKAFACPEKLDDLLSSLETVESSRDAAGEQSGDTAKPAEENVNDDSDKQEHADDEATNDAEAANVNELAEASVDAEIKEEEPEPNVNQSTARVSETGDDSAADGQAGTAAVEDEDQQNDMEETANECLETDVAENREEESDSITVDDAKPENITKVVTADDNEQDVDKEVELLTENAQHSPQIDIASESTSSDTRPPDDFHLKPIRDKLDSKVKISLTEASLKPFDNVGVFGEVDTHASEVSQEFHANYRNLVWHLIHARGIDSDLDKARAVFVYLCSKDLSKVSVDDVDDDSPDKLFVGLQLGETTYACVFETLCSYVGLHCEAVNGYAKGADYRPGMHFEGIDGQHSWNVVLIDGTWRLVDCHWAARRLVGKQVSPDNVRYELDEYYFMPDPQQLIFTHFPLDPRWQLLQDPISLEEFEELVPVKSTFFKHDLQLLSHRNAVVDVVQEQTIVLGCPPAERGKRLVFTFTLTSDELGDSYDGVDLSQFGMQHIVDGCESHFTVRPPQPGTYQLVIYAKEQQNTDAPFGGVCEYHLACRQSYSQPMSYPPCAHTTWGIGDSAALYPLTPLHGAGAIIEVSGDGVAEIRLQMTTELRFSARLKSIKYTNEEDLSKYVMTRLVADEAIILVKLPTVGEFGLEIYANNPLTDGQSLRHVYQYLILCREPSSHGPPEPFPLLPAGYLGPQPGFKPLGLTLLSSGAADPYVVVDQSDVQLSFIPSQPVRLTAQLIDCTSATEAVESDEYVLQQSAKDGIISFMVRLTKPGFYKLQVFGALYTPEPAESLPGIYNFVINCRQTSPGPAAALFPRQYAAWRDGCYLHEPLSGQLPRTGLPVQFKVQVPMAASVAAVIGSEWIMLEKNDDGIWTGEVSAEKYAGGDRKVSVCAAYDSSTDSYSTLLEYTL